MLKEHYLHHGGKEDVSRTTSSVLSTIVREATRRRHEHLTNQTDPALMCAGQVFHPSNFLQFVSGDHNHGDKFWCAFYKAYKDLPENILRSIKHLRVSPHQIINLQTFISFPISLSVLSFSYLHHTLVTFQNIPKNGEIVIDKLKK